MEDLYTEDKKDFVAFITAEKERPKKTPKQKKFRKEGKTLISKLIEKHKLMNNKKLHSSKYPNCPPERRQSVLRDYSYEVYRYASANQDDQKKMRRRLLDSSIKQAQEALVILQSIRINNTGLMNRLGIKRNKLYEEIIHRESMLEMYKKEYATYGGVVRDNIRQVFGVMIYFGYTQGKCLDFVYDILCYVKWDDFGVKDLEGSHIQRLRQLHQQVLKERKKYPFLYYLEYDEGR